MEIRHAHPLALRRYSHSYLLCSRRNEHVSAHQETDWKQGNDSIGDPNNYLLTKLPPLMVVTLLLLRQCYVCYIHSV